MMMIVMNLVALTAERREGNEYKVWWAAPNIIIGLMTMMIPDDFMVLWFYGFMVLWLILWLMIKTMPSETDVDGLDWKSPSGVKYRAAYAANNNDHSDHQ